jgi:hypothetical protein
VGSLTCSYTKFCVVDPHIAYGAGTPGCLGAQFLYSTSPSISDGSITFTTDKTPPGGIGLLLIGDAPDTVGTDVFGLGFALHVDLFSSTELYAFDMFADAAGVAASPPLALPPVPDAVGRSFYAQSIWYWGGSGPCVPWSPLGLSSSNGLCITIVP